MALYSYDVFARGRNPPQNIVVIARSESDEAIPRIEHFTWDCFVAFAPRNDILYSDCF
ncbi:MAG: hypothetical protein FWC80_01990 [Firmicutes bacterium]|nr:hypothetical protein [Bacillota bacterium]